MALDMLPNRNGWFKLACWKSAPAAKYGTKVELAEKPVRTMPLGIALALVERLNPFDLLGDAGIHRRQGKCLSRSKRMANVHNLVGLGADTRQRAVSQRSRQLGQGRNFKRCLDLISWISVGRVANTETIVRESTVPCGESCIDVAIVEVVVVQVPVSSLHQLS